MKFMTNSQILWLKIGGVDQLFLHPVAGFSFERFLSRKLIRGFQTTRATGLEFYY